MNESSEYKTKSDLSKSKAMINPSREDIMKLRSVPPSSIQEYEPTEKKGLNSNDTSDKPYEQIYDLIIDAYYKCKCDYCNKIRELIDIPFIDIATAISEGESSYIYIL